MAQPDKPGGKQKPKREHDVHVRGTIYTNLSPDEEKRRSAERKQDATAHETERKIDLGRESHKVWLERFTLLAVIIYAGITCWQGCLTRESITNNTKQFQIDQRPYVWDNNVRPGVSIEPNQKMWANIVMINFGKSPALKTRIVGKIFVGPNAMSDADSCFTQIGDNRFQENPADTGTVVPPGIPAPVQPLSEQELAKPIPSGKVRMENETFGGGGLFTIMTDDVLKQPDVDYVLGTEQSAVLVAHLEYFDGFGNVYMSNICLSRFKNGNMPHCTRHNEIR